MAKYDIAILNLSIRVFLRYFIFLKQRKGVLFLLYFFPVFIFPGISVDHAIELNRDRRVHEDITIRGISIVRKTKICNDGTCFMIFWSSLQTHLSACFHDVWRTVCCVYCVGYITHELMSQSEMLSPRAKLVKFALLYLLPHRFLNDDFLVKQW